MKKSFYFIQEKKNNNKSASKLYILDKRLYERPDLTRPDFF